MFDEGRSPFILQQSRDGVTGLNLVGLRRAGTAHRAIDALRSAFRIFYRESLPTAFALDRISEEIKGVDVLAEFVDFICESRNGVNRVRRRRGQSVAG